MKFKVIVMPKVTVLDPQGVAVRNAIKEAGLSMVDQVRVGKVIEVTCSAEPGEEQLKAICHDLLSNPVVEDYQIIWPEGSAHQ